MAQTVSDVAEDLMRDYVRHMRHHLQQILAPEGSRGKTHPPFA